MHRARITRTGNTTMIELPGALADRLQLVDGDTVEVEASEDGTVLVIQLAEDGERGEIAPSVRG